MTKASRVFQLLPAAALVAGAIACGNSPNGSTISPSTASTRSATVESAVTVSDAGSGVDFARCLGGGGDAGCFSGGRVRAGSTASSPVTSSPLNLAHVVSGSTVILTWTQPPFQDFPVSSYVIEAASAPGGPANLANFNTGNSSTSLTVPGVPNGTYYVRVRALNSAGLSAASNEIAVVVGGGGGGGCATAPRSLAVASQSAGTISLAWLAPATGSPTSYVVRAGSSPGLSNLADLDTQSTALSFVAPGVPSGSYYVRAYSRSSCGLSAASNEVLVFVIGFSSDVQVSVSWDAPSDVDLHVVEPSGVEIYYGNDTSPTGGQLDVDSNPACSIDGRQIENIRWTQAPVGTYTVRVDYWDDCGVARTNYLVTVKNGPTVQTFSGFFTGAGDNGGQGSGVLITTFFHAASAVAAPVLEIFRAPSLFTPSAAKLKAQR